MTILVLDISVPQISSHSTVGGDVIAGTELFKKLYDLWPKILSFGISFLIWLYIGWLITDSFITLSIQVIGF